MATGPGRLGAVSLSADVNATVYRCPITSFAVVSLTMVNRGNDSAMLYVAVASSDTPDISDYIEYDTVLEAKCVLERTGIVVGSEQYLIVRSDSDYVNAVAYGIESLLGPPRPPSYELIGAANNIDESLSLSFTVNTTAVDSGTVLYWTIDSNPGDFAESSGTVTINSNTGSFSVTPTADAALEGEETFTVSIRSGSTVGPILDTTSPITINDASTQLVSMTLATSQNENNSTNQVVYVNGIDRATTDYYWVIDHITSSSSDFLGGTDSGLIGEDTAFGNDGSGSWRILADSLTEGPETFRVQIRSGSISGPILATSSTVTINDNSITPAATINLSGVTTVSEGSALSFGISVVGLPNGTTVQWRVINGTTDSADFTSGGQVGFSQNYNTSTQICVFGIGFGSTSHSITTATNGDAPETFRIQVERTTGAFLGISDEVTITA